MCTFFLVKNLRLQTLTSSPMKHQLIYLYKKKGISILLICVLNTLKSLKVNDDTIKI